jgi:hypothetical protein
MRVIDSDKGQVCAKNEKALNFNQTGPQGPAGAQGPAGVTDVYIKHDDGAVNASGAVRTRTTLTVPPGSYLVIGKAAASHGNSDGQQAGCWLTFGPVRLGDQSFIDLPGVDPSDSDSHRAGAIAVNDTVTFSEQSTITMDCYLATGMIGNVVLTATAVTTVHEE